MKSFNEFLAEGTGGEVVFSQGKIKLTATLILTPAFHRPKF